MAEGYQTRQRRELMAYLEKSLGSHFTAQDVCDHFRGLQIPIGAATVYRRLERLVDEGLVNKYTLDGSGAACFEYVPAESHIAGPDTCFHCRCEKCGKLIHLHCDELEEIAAHLLKEHAFALNPLRTVFYGVCQDCRDREDAQ